MEMDIFHANQVLPVPCLPKTNHMLLSLSQGKRMSSRGGIFFFCQKFLPVREAIGEAFEQPIFSVFRVPSVNSFLRIPGFSIPKVVFGMFLN
jgi:hypothetical protein